MNGLDWVIVAVIGISVLVAAAQGFFFEIFSLAGAVAGYLAAAWQYPALAPVFVPHVKSPAIANLVAFLTIFIVVLVLAGAIGRVVRWAIHGVGLRTVDRVLGAAFGLVRGGIMVTVGVLALATFAPESPWLARSELGRYFLLAGRMAVYAAPAEMREKFRSGLEIVREAASAARTAGGEETK